MLGSPLVVGYSQGLHANIRDARTVLHPKSYASPGVLELMVLWSSRGGSPLFAKPHNKFIKIKVKTYCYLTIDVSE